MGSDTVKGANYSGSPASSEQAATHIGARLQKAREERGLTLRDISNETKVPLNALQAIEQNDVAQLRHGIFTRGFVKAYAAEVGLDPAEVLDEYLSQFHFAAVPEPSEPLNPEMAVPYEDEPRSRLPLLAVLALGAAIAVYGARYSQPAESFQGPIPEAVATSGELETPAPAAAPVAADAIVSDGLHLQMQARGTCVVSVSADGRPVTSRLVQPGETITVDGHKEIALRVDDTACVASISGMPGVLRAGPGAVTMRIVGDDPDGAVGTTGVRTSVSTTDARPVPVSFRTETPANETPVTENSASPAVPQNTSSELPGEAPVVEAPSAVASPSAPEPHPQDAVPAKPPVDPFAQ